MAIHNEMPILHCLQIFPQNILKLPSLTTPLNLPATTLKPPPTGTPYRPPPTQNPPHPLSLTHRDLTPPKTSYTDLPSRASNLSAPPSHTPGKADFALYDSRKLNTLFYPRELRHHLNLHLNLHTWRREAAWSAKAVFISRGLGAGGSGCVGLILGR